MLKVLFHSVRESVSLMTMPALC